jgi:mannose-6-phosphate isomerase-like protein (cupin superfamily)
MDKKEEELPPNILMFGDAEVVRDNQAYVVKDLYFADPKSGDIRFTMTHTTLHSGQQTTGHSHGGSKEDRDELFRFEGGNGIMLLGGNAVFVKPGMYVFVPRETFHKVININTDAELIFTTYYGGKLVRPDRLKRSAVLKEDYED